MQKNLFAFLLTFLILPISELWAQADKTKQPNILLILTDDMGYGDLGYTGSTQIKTPNIDRLAHNGVIFNQAYVTASVCAPSRAGMITGRYQQRFGFNTNPRTAPWQNNEMAGLPVEEKTLGDRMQTVGYHTAVIGKWHLGYDDHFYPTRRGFDYFFGMRGGGHAYFPEIGVKKQKDPFGWYPRLTLERMGKPIEKVEVPYLTDWFTDEAMQYMTREGKNEKPWFLYLAYNAPHGPLQAKEEDIAKYEHIEHKGRRIYCAMVDNLDQNVGRLVETLKATGQFENTVIIFLNDNGGSVETVHAINAPYWGTKGTFYEGGIRVPMFIHNPQRFKKQSYNKAVTALDIVPTCIALAGGQQPPRTEPIGRRTKVMLDGHNLMPYLNGDKVDARPYEQLYWQLLPQGSAVIDGDWKLINTVHSPAMLFNIAKDPQERNNLINKEPEIYARLIDLYEGWRTTHERPPMWQFIGGNQKLYRKQFKLTQPE